MPTDNGYSNQKKKGIAQFETVHNLGFGSYGKSVANKSVYEITPSAAIVSVTDIKGSNGQVEFWNIQLTSHGAQAGNVFRIDSGSLQNAEYEIIQVIDANNFYILPITDVKPAALDTGVILGWVTQKLASDGSTSVSITSAPTQFNLDGVPQTVEQDTVTPANNRPFPSGLFIEIDGVSYPVGKDTGTPSNSVLIPVEVSGVSGPINITAGDLNVQLTDLGANFDRVRIGDGTNQLAVNSDGSISSGALVETEATLDGGLSLTPGDKQSQYITEFGHTAVADIFLRAEVQQTNTNTNAINNKLPAALGQQVEASSLSVTLSTENEVQLNNISTTNSSIDSKTPDLVGGRVPVDGSGVTQPISAASLPLPTGAATEATLEANGVLIGAVNETAPGTDTASSGLNGRLQRIAQRLTSLIALLPTSLGQKASADSLATVLSTEQEALLTAIRDGVRSSVPNGSSQSNSTVGTTAANVAIPANTVGFIIQGFTGNAGLYWSLAATAANDGTSGHKLEDSRDSGFIPYAGTGNLSVIGEAASTRYQITWFTRS